MIWREQATWRGPSPNESGAMVEHRGLVLHIAEGFYDGTIGYQLSGRSRVSSHFIVGRDGRVAQMVDTDLDAWAEKAGNSRWLSSENEGFTLQHRLHATHSGWEYLTAAQLDANARLLLRAHQDYGVPLQVAHGPAERGLGHHSMGGVAWGHPDCPGPAIIGQKQAIVDRARALAGGQGGATDVGLVLGKIKGNAAVVVGNGRESWPVTDGGVLDRIKTAWGAPLVEYDTWDQVHAVVGSPAGVDVDLSKIPTAEMVAELLLRNTLGR